MSTEATDESKILDDAEQRLVALVRDHYAPEPLSPGRRAAFDVRLRERTGRSRRRIGLWPALAAAASAAALAALLLFRTPALPPERAVAEQPASDTWAARVLYADGSSYGQTVADDEALPAEYAAIADAFLDRGAR
jgi:hypothetical protein